jgi:O-antigen polymerase
LTLKTSTSLVSLCCLLPIALSLFDTGFFGSQSLAAYFGFALFALCIATILLATQIKRPISLRPQEVVFLILTLYVWLRGSVTHTTNLTHFYWGACALFLLGLSTLKAGSGSKHAVQGEVNRLERKIFSGITILSFFEALIVILQCLKLIPSKNALFACTGTWTNPNVTAMFLALSLLSQKKLSNNRYRKSFFAIQIFVVLLAIFLLQCRTAYIIAAICLLEIFKLFIPANRQPQIKVAVITLFIAILAFGFKTASTDGRLQIWRNCLELCKANPITGVGFGQFEKEYNAFVATANLSSKDHVYMAYNDFVELAVEGGIIAVMLWLFFLISLARQFKSHSWGLSLVICFITIQLTNFGFQAIPVFALFILYAGLVSPGNERIKYSKAVPWGRFVSKSVMSISLLSGFVFFTKLFSIAGAFHQTTLIREGNVQEQSIEKYRDFSTILSFSSIYHENYGDALMQMRNYQAAKSQYCLALQTTTRPDVLGKCGWCFGQLGEYDSAFYCFKTIEKLQPYRYAPRMAMLKLYEQKRDTASAMLKAQEIIAMPVKVRNAEVDRIKSEAGKWLQVKL